MNHGGCPFTEFDLLHNTFGFESVILSIYCFLESIRYWVSLAELGWASGFISNLAVIPLIVPRPDIRVTMDCGV